MGTSQAIAACKKIAFLTFDDGLQPGTQEVYNVIKSKGVKATFFLTGAHTKYAVETMKQGPLLKKLAEDPEIDLGNHSSSHANQYYEGYYDKGGVLLKDGKTRRTVLDDFKHCDKTLSKSLGLTSPKKWNHARLPGRNTWRAVPGVADETAGDVFGPGDTYDEANALKSAGYQIYGWDYEWEMDFDGTTNHSDYDAEVDRACESAADKICWREENYRKSFRFISTVDRVKYDASAAAAAANNKITAWFQGPRKTGKLIILMHERAFRGPKEHTDKLANFIDALKIAGFCFDKISNF